MILDYSEHVKQISSFGLNSGKNVNRDLYFDTRGICKRKLPCQVDRLKVEFLA